MKLKLFFTATSQTIQTIIRIILFSKWFSILKHKDLKVSEKCVILGNGPSFKQSMENYSDYLIQTPCLAVNNFALSEDFQTIQPKYYVCYATVLFKSDDQISALYADLKHTLIERLLNCTKWEMFLMMPFCAKKSPEFNALLAANQFIKPIYGNDAPAEGYTWFKHFAFRKGLGIPRPHNVLIPSIMNLIILGVKRIEIIGADHSWLSEITVNENNIALVHQKHFYDEDTSKAEPMQDYIVRPRRLHEILNKFQLTFQGYWEIKDFARKQNTSIINCSEVSLIDAFDREPLNTLKDKN